MVVVGKLCMGDLISLGTQVRSTEDLKVHFDFLVNMFCFTVGLRIVDSGKGEVIVKEYSKLLGEDRGKLWAMMGDDLVVESEA